MASSSSPFSPCSFPLINPLRSDRSPCRLNSVSIPNNIPTNTPITTTHSTNIYTNINNIQSHLLNSLPKSPPHIVLHPVQSLIESAPPSVAPALCLAISDLLAGGSQQSSMDVACGVQLLHTASYSHDQLDSLRSDRADASLSSLHPASSFLLSHMTIYAFAHELIGTSKSLDHELALRVLAEFAEAMGPRGVLEGQGSKAVDGTDEFVVEKREGAIGGCGAACGALVGGGSVVQVEKLRRFGVYVGTLHGLHGLAGKCEGVVKRLRDLALSEIEGLEGLDEERVEGLMRFVDL